MTAAGAALGFGLFVLTAGCQPNATQQTSARPATGQQPAMARQYPLNAVPIAKGFGQGRIRGVPADRDYLKGIDIYAPEGSAVLAVDHLEVVETGHQGRCGKQVLLRSTRTGMTFTYCHLDRIEVRTGDQVKPGDLIGLMGRTGERVPPDHGRLRLVAWETGSGDDEIRPVPPEPFLFGAIDGRAECPDPEKIGKDPSRGGYGLGRWHEAKQTGKAMLLYPVCDLTEATGYAAPPTPVATAPPQPAAAGSQIRMHPKIEALLQSYFNKPNPGAFAVSGDGNAAGYTFCSHAVVCSQRRRTERHAIDVCREYSRGEPCEIYAWRGKIVQ